MLLSLSLSMKRSAEIFLLLATTCTPQRGASVDLDAATVAGVPVLFPPGRNAVSVAEYTIGMMISVARHLHTAHHLLRYTDTLTKMRYADKLDVRSQVTSEWSLEPGAPFQ